MFEDESAVAAVVVAQHPGAPVLARGQGHGPVVVRETLPPLQLDDAAEAQIVGQVSHAPGHDGNFGVRQPAEGRFVEMVEVGMGQEHQVNGRQVLEAQAGAFEAFQQKEPVGEVGVNEHVQVRELDQERGMADPSDGDLAGGELGERGAALVPVRRVSRAFQTISRKKVRGLKCLAGVKSLNERGRGWRTCAGRYGLGLLIFHCQS